MRIYLAGPITGVPDYRRRFLQARTNCGRKGHLVMDPSCLPAGFDWEDYMPICLAMLERCDAICLLTGWERSRGAQKELWAARHWGKKVFQGPGEVPDMRGWTEREWKKPGETPTEIKGG